MMKRSILVVAICLVAIAHIGADQPKSVPAQATALRSERIEADRHDRSPRLRDILLGLRGVRRGLREREPESLRRVSRPRKVTPDPNVQNYPSVPLLPGPSTSIEGIGSSGDVLPADSNGDVGPNHYVQWANLQLAVYSKGTSTTPPALIFGPVPGNALWAGFGGPCETQNDGDPVVRYDHLADRWVMSQVAVPNSFGGLLFAPFYQCIAVSATPDPTGRYYRYQYSFKKLNDSPKLAVWPDAYYMTMNEFSQVSLKYAGQGVVALEREKMLKGLPAAMVYFDLESVDKNLGGMLPADLDGPPPPAGSPAYYAQVDDDAWGYSPDQIQIWQFHVDWAHPSASSFTRRAALPTAPFDSDMCGYARNCVPQPGASPKLDAMADRLMYRLQYRNFGTHESLVVNHTVDVDGTDHAGVRWYEIRNPGTTPSIYQQGTYAPDVNHRWMGSTAMDGAGNIALGFSVSGVATSPSIRYTGRLASDPLGTMTQGETDLMVGGGSQLHGSGRWGDYSMMTVDPVDDCTFWYTQEYYPVSSRADWHTRIGSFSLSSCNMPDLDDVSIAATTPTAAESPLANGMFTVTRTGDTSMPVTVQYSVGGDASAGSDYQALSGVVTIPAGASTATIAVEPIDDAVVESTETVSVTIEPDPAYQIGSASMATVDVSSDDVPPDLIVTTLTAPAMAGASTVVTITDTTENQGAGAADASATNFYLSTNGVLDAADQLLGSRPVSSLAVGTSQEASTTLTVPSDTPAGAYYIIANADGEHAIDESQEANNTKSSGPILVGPDLVVSTLAVPVQAVAGGSIVIGETTSNSGGGAAIASVTQFYLSTNTTLDAGDQLIGTRSVGALPAGGSESATTTFTAPSVPSGVYFVLAIADGANVVAETQEANNLKIATVRIEPDLIVSAVSAPPTANDGSTILVTDTTTNEGGGSAPASQTAFYLSTNAVFDAGDILLGTRNVPTLAPAGADAASTHLQIPIGTATGTYFLIAQADSSGVVDEANEANNSLPVAIQILPKPAVTLAATTPTATESPLSNGIFIVTRTGDTSAPLTVYYTVSGTAAAGSDYVALPGAVTIPSGAADAAISVVPIDDPFFEPNETVALAVASDPTYLIGSPSTAAVTFVSEDVAPDLTVTTLTVPALGASGGSITIGDTTSNPGGGAAAPSVTQFYLSTNGTLDPGDWLLGSRSVATIAAGASQSGSTMVSLPAVPAGQYFVLAIADGPSVVPETIETNNVKSAPIKIGADLLVSVLTVPQAAGAGGTMLVSDTTKNQGGASAPASQTAFYLSSDVVLGPGDVLLGVRNVPVLAAGATSNVSTSLQIPADTATGAYNVIAVADTNGVVDETSEANNTLAAGVVKIGPDLLMVALTLPANATAGSTITASDTTKNAGNGDAGGSTTQFRLSTNTTLDAGDVLIGSRPVGPLAAGVGNSGSATLAIPPGTAPGTYFVIALADGEGTVVETSETNNVRVVSIQIVP